MAHRAPALVAMASVRARSGGRRGKVRFLCRAPVKPRLGRYRCIAAAPDPEQLEARARCPLRRILRYTIPTGRCDIKPTVLRLPDAAAIANLARRRPSAGECHSRRTGRRVPAQGCCRASTARTHRKRIASKGVCETRVASAAIASSHAIARPGLTRNGLVPNKRYTLAAARLRNGRTRQRRPLNQGSSRTCPS